MNYYSDGHYNPDTGRFLQKDPHPGKMSIPQSVVNSYIYVANSPFNLSDPSGQDFFSSYVRPALYAFAGAFAILSGIGLASALGWGALSGAAAAVGSAALGSAAASLALAAGTSSATGKWGADFWNSFGDAFRFNSIMAAGFLAVSGILAVTSFGGFSGAGGSWVQGYVNAADNFGGLTLGSSSFVGGIKPPLMHELGHTFQFIGLSFFGGLAGGDSTNGLTWTWAMFLTLGAAGLGEQSSGRAFFWETMLPKP